MKGFAYAVLIVLLLSVVFEPYQEMAAIYVEKAKIASAVNNAGHLALERSINDYSRADILAVINLDQFQRYFNEGFCSALNLGFIASIGDFSYYKSLDQHYDNFSIKFDKILPNICMITVSSKYRYKTRYLKAVQNSNPKLLSFNLKIEESFPINVRN